MNLISRLALINIIVFFPIINLKSQPVMGFQMGMNISSLNGHKEYQENKPRFGLSAYVFTDVPLGRNSIVSIETGLEFSQQGMNHTRITEDIASKNTTTINNKLDYVVMPIYLKENYVNFYTKIGPYGAYLINAQSNWKNVEQQANQVIAETSGINEDFVKNAREYDIGLSIGFGYIHFFNNAKRRRRRRRGRRVVPVMLVDFKYNIGFTKIDAKGNTPDMDFKNRTFMFGLTITSVQNR